MPTNWIQKKMKVNKILRFAMKINDGNYLVVSTFSLVL